MASRRKVLITGGMGYVGGRVARTLASRADLEVVLGSRQAQLSPAWLPEARIVQMDWQSPESLLAACDGVDTVLHLAAMNEIDSLRDPPEALEVNGVNSVRLLEAAKTRRVARFVHLSTAHVYGAPLAGRIDECACPRPRHPYATSHRAAEDVVLAAHDDGILTGLVLRLSNGFGAPAHAGVDRWTLLVNDLCRQAVVDRRLVLRLTGLQRRDFVTLHDVGRAFSHVLDLAREQAGDGIFNVGGAWAPRVIDVAQAVQARCTEVLGYAPEIVRPQPASSEDSPELDYRIDRLLATGFALNGDRNAEIDATLRLCRDAFGGAGR
jgi:UDP-glucose 4-epimerase